VFGTQSRKVLADRLGVLKIEIAHTATDKTGQKVSQAGYQNITDYMNQNALKQCRKIYRSMKSSSSNHMTFSQVIVEICHKLHVPQKSIDFYQKPANMAEANLLFEQLSQLFEQSISHKKTESQKMTQYFGKQNTVGKKKKHRFWAVSNWKLIVNNTKINYKSF